MQQSKISFQKGWITIYIYIWLLTTFILVRMTSLCQINSHLLAPYSLREEIEISWSSMTCKRGKNRTNNQFSRFPTWLFRIVQGCVVAFAALGTVASRANSSIKKVLKFYNCIGIKTKMLMGSLLSYLFFSSGF